MHTRKTYRALCLLLCLVLLFSAAPAAAAAEDVPEPENVPHYLPAGGSLEIPAEGLPAETDMSAFSSEYITVTAPSEGVLRFSNEGLPVPAAGASADCVAVYGEHEYTVRLSVSAEPVDLTIGNTLQLEMDKAGSYSLLHGVCAALGSETVRDIRDTALLTASPDMLEEGSIFYFSPANAPAVGVYGEAKDSGIAFGYNKAAASVTDGTAAQCDPLALWELCEKQDGKYRIRNVQTGEYIYAGQLAHTGNSDLMLAAELPENAISYFDIIAGTLDGTIAFRLTDGEESAGMNLQGSVCLWHGNDSGSAFYVYRIPAKEQPYLTALSAGEDWLFDGETNYALTTGPAAAGYGGRNYTSVDAAIAAAQSADANGRLCSQVISQEAAGLSWEGVLPLGLLWKPESAEYPMLSYLAKSPKGKTQGSVVYPRLIGEKQYLFLPSCADYSALDLHLPAGTEITAEGIQEKITVGSDSPAVDLTAIFGDMSAPGACFELSVLYEDAGLRIAQQVTLVSSAGIGSLYMELEPDSAEDCVAWLNADKSHEIKNGTAMMLNASGASAAYDGKISNFHMRGNSSLGSANLKPSYTLKLDSKAVMTGSAKAKSWCLLAINMASRDTTTYSASIGFSLYQWVNELEHGDAAVSYTPVDLYINGEYRGMYILTDKINDDRVDITSSKYNTESDAQAYVINDPDDALLQAGIGAYRYSPGSDLKKNGGFILEVAGWETPEFGFLTRRGVYMEITEPGTPTKEQVRIIAMYYQAFEDALYSDTGYNDQGVYWADYIDLESFARYYLVKAFMQDYDLFWGSSYFYIDANDSGFTGKLKCCTAWDFDACFTVTTGGNADLFDTGLTDTSASDMKWRLLHFGELTAELRRENSEKVFRNGTMSFTDLCESLTAPDGLIDTYYEEVNAAMQMNCILWTNCNWKSDLPGTAADVVRERVNYRIGNWKALWAEETLQGIRIKQTASGLLRAEATGATRIDWYVYGNEEPVCTDSVSFCPEEPGVYWAKATGARGLTGTGITEMVSDSIAVFPDNTFGTVDTLPGTGALLVAVYGGRGEMLGLAVAVRMNGTVSAEVSEDLFLNAVSAKLFCLDTLTSAPLEEIRELLD